MMLSGGVNGAINGTLAFLLSACCPVHWGGGRRLCCLIRVLNDTQKLMTFLIFSVAVE